MIEMVDYKQGYRHYRRYYRSLRTLYQKPMVRDFTFLILSLLTAAFFGLFAIKPSLVTIGGLVKEVEDKRMASEKLAQKINSLSLAQREYASLQSDLPKVYAVLPRKSNFSKLTKQIEYLAGKNNIFLLNLRIQRISIFGEKKKELVPLELDFNLGGGYRNLKVFLEDLEKLERMVTIEDLGFSKKKTGREKIGLPLSLRISAKGYYLQ